MAALGLARTWPEATIVYPEGLPRRDPGSGRSLPGWQDLPGEYDDRDVRFVDALLKELSATYRVDEQRVFATGFSNGARFLFLLYGMRPERFAAFAPVAGWAPPQLKWATVPRPWLIVHGKRDYPVWTEWTRNQLLRVNGCGPDASEWAPGSLRYQLCASGQPVIWSLHAGGHLWPGTATASIVRFFQEAARPASPPSAEGKITTVVGEGAIGAGPAIHLSHPASVAIDGAGNLLIADPYAHRILKVPGVAAPGLLAGQPFR